MTKFIQQGRLEKMRTRLVNPVEYTLILDNQQILLNQYLGKTISLKFTGTINCIHCNRKTNKSFNQGYCYPCFISLAECDTCIMQPEKCHFELGTCRDPQWALGHCMQPHIVYLANSSNLKVGITRASQLPTRWIDQGAAQALPIFKVFNRMQSGLIEVELKKHISDRTHWQTMLKGKPLAMDLNSKKNEFSDLIDEAIKKLTPQIDPVHIEKIDAEQLEINYPVLEYPTKVTALNFDKTAEISGKLLGIKGQYLILDTGVLNIRKFGGYNIRLN